MGWLWRALAAPLLWAALFSAIYALHGAGCNLGWTGRPAPLSDLHHLAMWLVWGGGLALHLVLIRVLPAGQGRPRRLIVMGTWIGFVSSLFTLFPVLATSSCV
ncbi:MAG: hypothetical protein ACK41U_12150 [Paracoccus sp. (in: a-proteobacteria)]|uniref:hypothetical protein n=1 Tax=Paracoccus sp. TaxID=267 RepID=UPI00391C76A3